jgi:MFS family permease
VFGRKSDGGHDDAVHDPDTRPVYTETSHERYGGFTFAAAFYGWLVAVAMTVLLAGIVGAGATGAGYTLSITQSEAEEQAGTIGLASAIALLVILLIAYFAGGYVAGRMSRFDGGRQGLGVWLLGLLVAILVAVLGAVFGTQYDIFERVNLPSVPIPTNTLTVGGVVTLVAVVIGTLMAAMVGGKAGQRYHTKIDRAAV